MKKTFVLLCVAHVMAFQAEARLRTDSELRDVARQAIAGHRQPMNSAPRQGELKMLHQSAGISVLGYDNGGFAVVANDDVIPEVLGVSDAEFSAGSNPGFQWWLNAINEVCEASAAHGAPAASNVPTPVALGFEANVDPIVLAEWDQDSPYWNMCPKDRNNGRCLTGCVATAIAQVLYTHRTPVDGSGSRTNHKSYSSQNPSGSYQDITFVYDGWKPDYDNMIDRYTSGPTANQYTDAQANAVADLMLACGVVVNMDYGSDGSGAYTDQAAEGLIQYMGITTADFKERDSYSDTEWMTMIYEELAGGHAMYYSGVDSNPWTGGGHAFVCDGYDEAGKVHINWGWSGKDNGFYNINLLNPSSYEFSKYQDFIRGLWDPNETSSGVDYVNLAFENVTAGALADSIGTDNLVALRSIAVAGELNADDIALLNKLASGADLTDMGVEGVGHLATIDLSDAVLANDEIADNAFKDCAVLTSVKLPRQLSRIGNNAFAGCARLNRIQAYTYNVPKMGTRVFENVRNLSMRLYFIAGSSEYYRRNAQWKTIVNESNVNEFGTCLKARNASREYGVANPVLGYQLVGDRVVGTPSIWTDATETSEPGKYTIYIEAGTIESVKDIVFVNGVLTVKPSTSAIEEISADEATRVEYSLSGVRLTNGAQHGAKISQGKVEIRK